MKLITTIGMIACTTFLQFNVLAKNIEIFDGKTLNGWHLQKNPGNPKYISRAENFIVKDNALQCKQSKDRKGALIVSDQHFSDFELTLELKSDWGCDSGIFLRTDKKGGGIQILNDYLNNGNVGFIFGQGSGNYISRPIRLYDDKGEDNIIAKDIYDAKKTDGLKYAISAKEWTKIWKSGQWNKLKVRITGEEPLITTWINGTKVMEFDGRTYKGRNLKDENVGNFDTPSAWNPERIQRSGAIAFQVHPGGRWKKGGSAQYKNIRVKEL